MSADHVCHCGARVLPSPQRSDTYINLEKKLLYGQDTPEVLQALQHSCITCLESMLHDLEMEHVAIPSDHKFTVLQPGTREYTDVAERFIGSISIPCKVYRIEKNHNDALLQEYHRHSTPDSERLLFHGSRNENYIKILTKGFDRSKSRAGSLGYGVYFALNAGYSHNYTYSVELTDTKGIIIRNMLLCRVSLHEARAGTDIWCIPDDRQAYPEYIIYYIGSDSGAKV